MIADTGVQLPDGRVLAYCEVGDVDGRPVFACHGGLSCRLEVRFAEEVCARSGVRLIAPDRPGIGGSDRQAGRRIDDWPRDVSALADALGLERFAVMGWSAGGPYALACGALLPERVTRVASVAGIAPLCAGDVRQLGLLADRLLFPLAAHAPGVAALSLSVACRVPRAVLQQVVGLALRSVHDPDVAELGDPGAGEVAANLLESLRQGGAGTARDYRLLAKDWGFPLRRTGVQADVWHGEADGMVPPAHARRLAGALPRGHLRLVPGRGHFLLRWHLEEVLQALLA